MKKFKKHYNILIDDPDIWYCHKQKKFVKGYCGCGGMHSSSYLVKTLKKAEKIVNRILYYDKIANMVIVERHIKYTIGKGQLIEQFIYHKGCLNENTKIS